MIDTSTSNKIHRTTKCKANQRAQKTIESSHVLKTLRRHSSIQNNSCAVLSTCSNELMDYLVDKANKNILGDVDENYAKDLKKFAVTLYFYGPQAYDSIRREYNLSLPDPRAISLWYQKPNSRPGITKQSVDIIKMHALEKQIYICLFFNEIDIKEKTEWVGLHHYGYVNIGNDLSGDSVEKANEAIVVSAAAINDTWRYPLAFFFGRNFLPTQKSILLKLCIDALSGENINIVAITLKGSASNMNLARVLGANIDSPPFRPYFMYNNTKHYLVINPKHLYNMTKELFCECKVFYHNKEKIDIAYIQKLHTMSDRLAIKTKDVEQLLRNSVATEMERFQKQLFLEFTDSAATVKFIQNISEIFCWFLKKRPITLHNHKDIFAEHFIIYNYIQELEFCNRDLVVHSPRKLALTSLMCNILVTKCLSNDYVKTNKLKSIEMYKFASPKLIRQKCISAKDLSFIYGHSLIRAGVIEHSTLKEVNDLKDYHQRYKTRGLNCKKFDNNNISEEAAVQTSATRFS